MRKEERDELYRQVLEGVLSGTRHFDSKKAARIDLKNLTGGEADLEWLMITDPGASLTRPDWFNKDGNGYVLTSDRGRIAFRVKCVGGGELEFTLRGVDKKDKDGKRIPLWIDYKSIMINGRYVLKEPKSVWHDKPHRFRYPAEDGDTVYCMIEWAEHV